MWLGYCLTVDGLVFMRKGNSLLTRDPKAYALMFLISMPGWWLFELFNLRLQNWVYLGMEEFSNLEYFLLSSLSFSTVMPAVFGTAELAGTFLWIRNLPKGPKISPNTRISIFWHHRFWHAVPDADLAQVFFPLCLAQCFLHA